MDSLTNDAPGRWLITTKASTRYLIDLDQRWVCRMPAAGVGNSMRRDFHDVTLLRMTRCQVAEPLVLLVDLRIPGALMTKRTSSPVTLIERADLDEDIL